MKKCALALVFLVLFFASRSFAIQLTERHVKHFNKNVCRVANELLKKPGVFAQNEYSIKLNNVLLGGFLIKRAEVVFSVKDMRLFKALLNGSFSIEELQNAASARVNYVEVSPEAVQAVINREVARVKPAKRIFDSISVEFLDGAVRVKGRFDSGRVLNSGFGLVGHSLADFDAVVSAAVERDEILLDIEEGQINN